MTDFNSAINHAEKLLIYNGASQKTGLGVVDCNIYEMFFVLYFLYIIPFTLQLEKHLFPLKLF